MKNRDTRIDLIKGITIILMVCGHAGISPNVQEFIYLFHMAVFFIASGYLYKSLHSYHDLYDYVKKKLKSLYLPYVITSFAFIILNNCFVYLNIYTLNTDFLQAEGEYISLGELYSIKEIIIRLFKSFFMQSNTQLGGALWFIKSLFIALIIYAVIDVMSNKVFKLEIVKDIIKGTMCGVGLIIGSLCYYNDRSLQGLNIVFSSLWLIYFGNMIKRNKIYEKLPSNILYLLSLVAFFVLLYNEKIGIRIRLNSNNINNPLYYVVCSVAGWTLMFGVSTFLLHFNKFKIIILIEKISINSIFIVCLHFLSFSKRFIFTRIANPQLL